MTGAPPMFGWLKLILNDFDPYPFAKSSTKKGQEREEYTEYWLDFRHLHEADASTK